MNWEESKCKVNKYCDFEVIGDHPDAVVERCRFCHRKVIYNVVGGRTDNQKYLRHHVRDFCQPYGITGNVYREIYGVENLKRWEREEAEKKSRKAYYEKDAIKDAKSDLKVYKRLQDKGYTFEELMKQKHDAQQKALKAM